VKTPVSGKAEMTKYLKIDDKVYWVTLEEELSEVDREMSRR